MHGNVSNRIDSPMGWGTAISVISSAVGFILKWGPIIWGLIGFVIGVLLGFLIQFTLHKVKNKKGNNTEVFVLIHCTEEEVEGIKELLRTHQTLGMAMVHHLKES
ncbi:hypothetical protein ABFG93_15370 [Pseudalkalibacillus hwajinpoensis]|uniref:hypothetical protein n=1 Tax=Guptibacillus hwajinpoensis TaxID=208199 RepID=UPI00325AF47C